MTATKPKPCTLAARHKWTPEKDVTITRRTGRTVRISCKTLYRCECGEGKYGELLP